MLLHAITFNKYWVILKKHTLCIFTVPKQCGESTWPNDLLLFLAPHKVGFFRISLEFVRIKRRVRGKSISLEGGVSDILRSGLILEIIRRMFLLSIWATGTMYMNSDEKHSPNVLENRTRLQYNSAYSTRNSFNFRVFCALFEQIPLDINRDILTWCGAKNSNKLRALSHLVTWIPHTVKR